MRRPASLLRQASSTSVIAGLAVLAGFLLDVTIAARYGAGPITDSFFVAARVPMGVWALAIAAANQALVPAFSASLNQRGERATWRLASILITAIFACGALVVAAVFLLAGPLVAVTAPGLPSSEAKLALELIPVTFALIPLVVCSEVLRALLNARYAFVVPAAINVALSGTTAAVILLAPHDPHVIAEAYIVGGLVQIGCIFAFALRNGFRFRPSLRVRDEHFASVMRLSVRPIISGGLNPVARIGEQVLMSFLPPGSITIVNYGQRLIHAIGGTVFFRSVIVTLLPRLSAAGSDSTRINRLTRQGLGMMLALSLPLTAFVAVLGRPGAVVVFERGRFTRNEALLLGLVLTVYAFSLVGSAVQRALLAPFFALLDTRTPLRNTVYGVLANLVLLPLAVGGIVLAGGPGVVGVAAAYSLAQYVNVAHAAYRVRSVAGNPWSGLGPFALKVTVATVLCAVAMVPAERWLGLDQPHPRLVELAGTVAVGLVGLVVLAAALGFLFRDELRRRLRGRTQGTDVPLRSGPESEINAEAAEAAHREGAW